MKLPSFLPSPNWRPARRRAAFTLAEVLIANTVFVLLVGGIVSANLFGLRMSQITQTKLEASRASRKLVGKLADEIRCAKSTTVGTVSNGNFTACLDTEQQCGTGLLICSTTNTANYVLYFLNPADQTFRRTTSGGGPTIIFAQGVTNAIVFTAQDCLGNVLTNSQNNRVIHFLIESFQPQVQLNLPDYYRLETSVTKRALE